MDNKTRIHAAAAALATYGMFKDPATAKESLSDLLADLMHLAGHYDIDFGFALLNARMHYDAEQSNSD